MTSAENNSPESSLVVTQYETLRSAVPGGALPPEARAGLMLLLRRGMWGWARAMATMSGEQQPTGFRSSNRKAPSEHRTVIHIFAAMVIQPSRQGATP